MKWITRSHVHVDRVACPWLITRFVDNEAEFLFVPKNQLDKAAAEAGAIPFDAPGVELGHHEGRCSFEAIMRKYGLVEPGLVRLATSDAFANELVPRLCVDFQRAHQGVQIDVAVMPTAEVPECVHQGVADIGLCFSRAPHKDVAVLYRQPAPVLALMLPDHPLATCASVTLGQMTDWPMALPPPQTTIRQMMDIVCSRQGLRLSPQLVSNHARLMLHFVLSGGGLTVSSEVAARHLLGRGAIVARPICDAGMDLRDIEVQSLVGRGLPLAVQAFLDLLRERLPTPLA